MAFFDNRKIGLLQQIVDHPLQAHGPTIIGGINTVDSVAVEFFDFDGKDGTTSASKKANVRASPVPQQVVEVLEKLQMPPLVGGDGNGLSVFLHGTVYNFGGRTVVTQVDDFSSAFLEDTAHNVDGRIVAVKKRGRGDNPDGVTGLIDGNFLHGCQITTGLGAGGLLSLLLGPTFARCPAIC